jgi:hypothetical protein
MKEKKINWELEAYDNGAIFQEAHCRILKLAQEQTQKAWEITPINSSKNENKEEF